jgi:competence protein ComEA
MSPTLVAAPALAALLALIGPTPEPAPAVEPARVVPEAPVEPQPAERRVNVNLAGEDALQVLPQVGPVVARRIVEYRRAVGPFQRVEELLNVKGIGRKTLDRLRPLITLGGPPLEADAVSRAAPVEEPQG